jgi:serine/threonine-protein kinase
MLSEHSSDVKSEIGQVLFVAAVKILQRLLSIPIGFYISIQQFKIDPVWDPIRNDPRFQPLLAGKRPSGPNKQRNAELKRL